MPRVPRTPQGPEQGPEQSPAEIIAGLTAELAEKNQIVEGLQARVASLETELGELRTSQEALEARLNESTNPPTQVHNRDNKSRGQRTKEFLTPRRLVASALVGAIALGGIFGVQAATNGGKEKRVAKIEQIDPGTAKASASSAKTNPWSKLTTPTIETATVSAQTASDIEAEPAGKKAGNTSVTTAREQLLDHVDDAETVAGTVHRFHTSDESVKDDAGYLLSDQHKPDKLDHTTSTGAMNSLLKYLDYGGKPGPNRMYLAVAAGYQGSDANMISAYNARYNDTASDQLPKGVTLEQVHKSFERSMTADKTTFSIGKPNTGTVMNYLQKGEHVMPAGTENLDGTKKVFTINFHDGTILRYKLFKGAGGELCINLLTPVRTIPGTPTTTFNAPPSVTNETPNPTPGTDNNNPGDTPGTNTTNPGETPGTTTDIPDEEITTVKDDPNTTPAGVEGQNHGTPDVAGEGPAGQPVDADGTVGNEVLPAAPAPRPEPAPLPELPPAPVIAGEEQGTDTGAGQTGSGSTSTGDTIPTTNPDPQG